ncbi:conserved hypothetical protein [Bacillus sp. 349Y]|nr:conserved hypothetical protein [Bacillus sp. 349Y]
MITKQDLKDWLAESERKEYAVKLEDFIDRKIKSNALSGETTFYISTGKYAQGGSENTSFYKLWNTEDLSESNRKIVQDRVLERYRDFGFDVEKTSVDCGWSNHYFALKFKNIDAVVDKS